VRGAKVRLESIGNRRSLLHEPEKESVLQHQRFMEKLDAFREIDVTPQAQSAQLGFKRTTGSSPPTKSRGAIFASYSFKLL
jgi:hypothetical protein